MLYFWIYEFLVQIKVIVFTIHNSGRNKYQKFKIFFLFHIFNNLVTVTTGAAQNTTRTDSTATKCDQSSRGTTSNCPYY